MMSTTTKSSYFDERGFTLSWEKVFIVYDAKGNRVETNLFFSLPFDSILQPFVEKLNSYYVWTPGMKGPGPIPPVAMFKAILYAKLNKNMSDRELERHLLRNRDVASALGFKKVPSHQTVSFFKRERLQVDLLEEVFNSLRNRLVGRGDGTWHIFSFKYLRSNSRACFHSKVFYMVRWNINLRQWVPAIHYNGETQKYIRSFSHFYLDVW